MYLNIHIHVIQRSLINRYVVESNFYRVLNIITGCYLTTCIIINPCALYRRCIGLIHDVIFVWPLFTSIKEYPISTLEEVFMMIKVYMSRTNFLQTFWVFYWQIVYLCKREQWEYECVRIVNLVAKEILISFFQIDMYSVGFFHIHITIDL